MRRFIFTILLALGVVLSPATAFASGSGDMQATPVAPIYSDAGTSPMGYHLACQYDVYRGQLGIMAFQVRNDGGAAYLDGVEGRMFSALVTNNAGTKRVALHVRGTSQVLMHVYHTYTDRNVKAWVSGVRCETT